MAVSFCIMLIIMVAYLEFVFSITQTIENLSIYVSKMNAVLW